MHSPAVTVYLPIFFYYIQVQLPGGGVHVRVMDYHSVLRKFFLELCGQPGILEIAEQEFDQVNTRRGKLVEVPCKGFQQKYFILAESRADRKVSFITAVQHQ